MLLLFPDHLPAKNSFLYLTSVTMSKLFPKAGILPISGQNSGPHQASVSLGNCMICARQINQRSNNHKVHGALAAVSSAMSGICFWESPTVNWLWDLWEVVRLVASNLLISRGLVHPTWRFQMTWCLLPWIFEQIKTTSQLGFGWFLNILNLQIASPIHIKHHHMVS